jgi:hypothetical protein
VCTDWSLVAGAEGRQPWNEVSIVIG